MSISAASLPVEDSELVNGGTSAFSPAATTQSDLAHSTNSNVNLNDTNADDCAASKEQNGSAEEEPVVDIEINNVVTSFNTRCHLNLRKIATEGSNVEYKRENGMVNMRIRSPNATASIWSSGKITCVGATSEELAKMASRKIARQLQRLGFRVRFTNYRVVNVLGTCTMPFAIRLNQFTENNYQNASYEPELHPAVTYRIKDPKATLKVFSTGSITVTAPSVANVQSAIEHIFPLVYPFRMAKTEATLQREKNKALQRDYNKRERYRRAHVPLDDSDSEGEESSLGSDMTDSEFDSEQSMD